MLGERRDFSTTARTSSVLPKSSSSEEDWGQFVDLEEQKTQHVAPKVVSVPWWSKAATHAVAGGLKKRSQSQNLAELMHSEESATRTSSGVRLHRCRVGSEEESKSSSATSIVFQFTSGHTGEQVDSSNETEDDHYGYSSDDYDDVSDDSDMEYDSEYEEEEESKNSDDYQKSIPSVANVSQSFTVSEGVTFSFAGAV